jgi:hypothetical protein
LLVRLFRWGVPVGLFQDEFRCGGVLCGPAANLVRDWRIPCFLSLALHLGRKLCEDAPPRDGAHG